MSAVARAAIETGPLTCQSSHFHLERSAHYLNCAYGAPLLHDVERAGRAALRRWRRPWAMGPETYFDDAERARLLFGRLIGARDGERIAIVPGVAYGIALAARNVAVRRGANIVIAAEQFPSNVHAWRRVSDAAGAELRVAARPAAGSGSWSERLMDAIDARTAVVALGTIDWIDGTMFDLEAIGDRARAVGAAYVLDGIQSLGALPFDVERVRPDLLVCAAYKWLLGPMGIGLCYVGERFAQGEPLEETWLGRRGSDDFTTLTNYADAYQPGARRFDASGRAHFILMPMLVAALRQLLAWGPAWVQDYCTRLIRPALSELATLGYFPSAGDPHAMHLFSVGVPPGQSVDAVRSLLERRRVHVSMRAGRIRISPHLYNAPEDLDALVSALGAATTRATAPA
jgi:selenocysteine lyase/cysteine desulfurase